ncbi:MAG: helix-turn-helix domain-containing protein [Rhizobiales bacterium]|nr:helix-turn-helix domain-containing protein [Hyphomicrobiales bacterium]
MVKLNKSIIRALNLLEIIVRDGPSSLSHLSTCANLPKPTVFRMCKTMLASSWLSQQSLNGSYVIGTGFPAPRKRGDIIDKLIMAAMPIINELSQHTKIAIDLAGPIGKGHTKIIFSTRNFLLHNIYAEVINFHLSPIRSALGSVYLAMLNDVNIEDILNGLEKILPASELPSLANSQEIIGNIRKNGYGIREDQYWAHMVDYGAQPNAVAIAIVKNKRPIGAMSLVWDSEQATIKQVVDKHLKDLQKASFKISEAMP